VLRRFLIGFLILLESSKVSVLSTGHEKMRLTVLLTARADGYKCKPFVLLPRKRPVVAVTEKFKNKLILCWSGRTWMDDSLTELYLNKVFGNFLFGNRLLVWDSFRFFSFRIMVISFYKYFIL